MSEAGRPVKTQEMIHSAFRDTHSGESEGRSGLYHEGGSQKEQKTSSHV